MELTAYQLAARTTAKYKSNLYASLGLAGEVGEMLSEDRISYDEAGDVAWYFANLLADCKLDMSLLADIEPAVVPDRLTLAGIVGCICNQVKKIHRDDGDELTETRKDKIYNLLRTAWAEFTGLLEKNGIDLSVVLKCNIDKLADRANRGVLSGDGDKR